MAPGSGSVGEYAVGTGPAGGTSLQPENNPPFSRQKTLLAVAAWTLAPTILWTNGFNIPQTDAPPPLERPWAVTARAAWEPEPPQPPRPRVAPQGAPFVEAPLFKTDVTGAVAQWFTEADTPRRRLGQIVSVDNPPRLKRAAPEWLEPWYQPPHVSYVVQGAPVADAPPALQRPWLSTALAAWVPPDVLVWSNGVEVQGAAEAAQTPYVRHAPSGWEVEWEQPARMRYVVQGAVQVDQAQPFIRRAPQWEVETPEIPRRQFVPQGAPQADQPPFGLRRTVAWETEWQQPQVPRYVVQGAAAAVDAPPLLQRPWVAVALQAWAVPDILVWSNGVQVQSGAAPADQPPPLLRQRYQVALQAWDRTLIPLWGIAANQATADAPVFARLWLAEAIRAWEPGPWPAQRRAKVVQGVAAAVDNPPFGLRPWLPVVLDSWKDTPYAPQVPRHAVQEGAASFVQPPFSRPWVQVALQAWETQLIPLWGVEASPQPSVDNPPFALRRVAQAVLTLWEPVVETPRRRVLLAQSAITDNPPVNERPWLATALRAWEPEIPRQPAQRMVVQGTPAQVDLPPFGLKPWLKVALQAWEPPPLEPHQLVRNVTDESSWVGALNVEWIIRARRRGRR